jgi:hypothetical protein
MSRNERDTPEARRQRRDRFELYYYERVGDRYYLRITRFAVYLTLALLVFAMTVLYLDGRRSRQHADEMNRKLGAPSGAPQNQPAQEPGARAAPSTPQLTRQDTGSGAGPGRRLPSPTPSPTVAVTPDDLPSPGPARSQAPPRPPN